MAISSAESPAPTTRMSCSTMLGRIDQTIADVRQILAGTSELARIPLRAHGQHDFAGVVLRACGGLEEETVAFPLHRLHFGIEDDVQALVFDMALPRGQDRLARAGSNGRSPRDGIITGSAMTNLRA